MRLNSVYDYVNQKLIDVPDDEARHNLYAHIYGVAILSELYALKRKLNPEIAVAAALLHDIAAVINNSYDNHAEIGADIAYEFLTGLGSYNDEEILTIVAAIREHTSDPRGFQLYDAILSETDYMQKYLYSLNDIKSNTGRNKLTELFNEFGIEWPI